MVQALNEANPLDTLAVSICVDGRTKNAEMIGNDDEVPLSRISSDTLLLPEL